jgi:organic radical activating enzyme
MIFDWNEHYKNGGLSGDPKGYEKSKIWKHSILSTYMHDSDDKSIIDVGCGDLQFWDGKLPANYTGIDISQEIAIKNQTVYLGFKKRDKTLELSLSDIEFLCGDLQKLGCKSMTITGGGEPLMHPDIIKIFEVAVSYGIKIGLVTNGLLLHKLSKSALDRLTWCRISCADERSFDQSREIIDVAMCLGDRVDWAFSYVIGKNYDADNLNKYVKFANDHNFTHVRVVSDLCDLNNCLSMDEIKSSIHEDDHLVIYQGRKEYDAGQERCWISLLKPLIGADGFIYPCRGVQYAHEVEDLDNPESVRMGRMENILDIYHKQIPFDGSKCHRCYYKNYNDILSQMMDKTNHLEFV